MSRRGRSAAVCIRQKGWILRGAINSRAPGAILGLRIGSSRSFGPVDQVQAQAGVEGTSFLRYMLDPSQYHRGRKLFTLTLTLTDNGVSFSDTLTIQAVVRR